MRRLIFNFSISRSKNSLIQKYGEEWFANFKIISSQYYRDIAPKIPNIGTSIFSMNYAFAPAYIAWYKALQQLKISPAEIDEVIWLINEKLMTTFPKFLLKASGKIYLNSFCSNAQKHVDRQNQGKLYPYDWKIDFRYINRNTSEIDITECAYKKLAKDFNVDGMLPGICRMDYLMANLMGNGFTRTKTLGDGEECCNCKYSKVGSCEWSPEKGFDERK